MGVSLYEKFTIFRCAVEGHSSSHHGSRHGADHHVMYGQRPTFLKWENGENEKLRKSQGSSECFSGLFVTSLILFLLFP
jgi:hypothetical protein